MYPTISEYLEAIKSAEDNFEQLKHLRPVLEDDGSPIMTSGNFAVVFKMKDEQTGKLHAVKCFLREQEGRAEAYRQIAEELEFVSSTFLTPIKYLDKELFVDTNAGDEKEFPVLLMDWVEGETLDKYIRKRLDDQYELSLLAYQFSRLAMWLMPQPFAHGDLKPDNILVKSDGTLVLVDYDGMYVPAMKGQKARELGSPDFRHPSRTEIDFDEHIDDFSLASILLSLKAISLQPSLLEEYGASDRLLFSEKDYHNLSESKVMDALKPFMQDAELASLYSLFILASSQNNLSGVSFRLFYLKRPSLSSPKKSLRVIQINKKIDNQSDKKIIKKELLASFQGKKNVWHILLSNGTSSYLTQDWSFNYEASAKGACKLNTVENDKKHVLFLFNDRDAEVGRYYIGEKLRGLTPKQLTEIKHELCFFEAWNPETNKWVPCVGKSKESVKKQKQENEGQRIEVTDEELDAWAAAIEENLPHDNKRCWTLLEFAKAHGKMQVGEFQNKETGESFKSCIFTNPQDNSRVFVAFSYKLGALSPKEIAAQKDDLIVVQDKDGNYTLSTLVDTCSDVVGINNENESLSTIVTRDDYNQSWMDILGYDDTGTYNYEEFGLIYSNDRKRLFNCSIQITHCSIRKETIVICDHAFSDKNIITVSIPNGVRRIGQESFYHCSGLKTISIPQSVEDIGDSAFEGCYSLTEVIFHGIAKLGKDVFLKCKNLKKIYIPYGSKEIYGVCLPDNKDKLVEQDGKDGICLAYCSEESQACEDKEYALWQPHAKIIKKNGKLGVVIDDGITKKQIIPFNYDTWFDYDGYETDIRENFFDNHQDYIGYFAIKNTDGSFTIHGYDKDGNITQSFVCEKFDSDSFLLKGKYYLRHSTDGEGYDDIRRMRMDCETYSDTCYLAFCKGNKWTLKSDDLKKIYIDYIECDGFGQMVWTPKGYYVEIKKGEKAQLCLCKMKSNPLILPNVYDYISWRHYSTNAYKIQSSCFVLRQGDLYAICSNELQYISPFIFSKVGSMINDNEVKVTRKVKGKEYEFVYRIVNSNGWRYNGTRQFNPDEVAAVKRTEVVASQYGNSLCIFMQSGGQTYIPLSKYSTLTVGDYIDLKTAKLITLSRDGDDDIYRVIE